MSSFSGNANQRAGGSLRQNRMAVKAACSNTTWLRTEGRKEKYIKLESSGNGDGGIEGEFLQPDSNSYSGIWPGHWGRFFGPCQTYQGALKDEEESFFCLLLKNVLQEKQYGYEEKSPHHHLIPHLPELILGLRATHFTSLAWFFHLEVKNWSKVPKFLF